ncbi:MAG: hypothetical protein WD294_04015 [Phycisphaeraceae bacterium]
MADANQPEHHPRHRLSPRDALSYTMMVWLTSLVIAGGAFGTALAVAATADPPTMPDQPIRPSLIIAAFIAVLGVVIPLAIHWRLMHRFWRGGVVEPRGYLIAQSVLYVGYALTVVILSVIAMVRVEAWMCEFMAAVLAMALLLLAWPTGSVMYHHQSRETEDSSDTLHLREEDEP